MSLPTTKEILNFNDIIVALATPPGKGAIAVIRLSGINVIDLVNGVFKGCDLCKKKTHTIHFGLILDGNTVLDEVLVSIFRAPKSFTHEDSVEISCHGSQFITKSVIQLLIRKGARMAMPGEFTKRAFLNGRFDLTQAEAVSDLIAANSAITHDLAIKQMRGGFSSLIKKLRSEVISFASLLELELDFSEEDVKFVNRDNMNMMLNDLLNYINNLLEGFKLGNVIKTGIPIVITGKPNSGKSTLLNTLLNEEKAIVSSIPGTTRDIIEDKITIDGIEFRFIDTAGLRSNSIDEIEMIGMSKTKEYLKKAFSVICLFDLSNETLDSINDYLKEMEILNTPVIKVGNKVDIANHFLVNELKNSDFIFISAFKKQNIDLLKSKLIEYVNKEKIECLDSVMINSRHYESLYKCKVSLERTLTNSRNNVYAEFLVQDVKLTLHHLGTITGEITTNDLLDNLFSKFCIGK